MVAESLGLSNEEICGPSTPTSYKIMSQDKLYCFRCYCPDILDPWISRPRNQGWPSETIIDDISHLDGHVVPVGCKWSDNMNIKWRICFTLAELHLMKTLNETQIKVYIILKNISKSVFKVTCKEMTSYIMKNVILWICETNGEERFAPELLIDRLLDCIHFINTCVIRKHLPSNMIPERNLLIGKFGDQQSERLISLLNDMLKEGGRILFRCNKIHDGMLSMYTTPDVYRTFGKRRDDQCTHQAIYVHRYFLHGVCKNGNNCRFSHDRRDKTDNVCKYYLKGCCSFAERCRYDHIKPKSSQSDETKSKILALPPFKDTSSVASGMVSLKKALHSSSSTPKTPKPPEQWVQATEFVPGQPYVCSSIPSSYANAASNGAESKPEALSINESVEKSSQLLCPYSFNKECPYGEECVYTHGEVCDLCGMAALLPGDEKQNTEHKKECMEQHEKDMELSFAVAQSKYKQCGICMDMVLEKEPKSERRFGILSDCVHCFCLACIRKWRASKQFDSKTIRSCPECRTISDFVTPSSYWVESKDEKIKLIQGYKQALSKKPCKYFDEGRGECPFSDSCFYLHLLPDGSKPPPQPRRRRRRHNADGDLDLEENVILWDFLQERQDRLETLLLLELLEDDLAGLLINWNFAPDSSEDSDDDYWL